MAKKKIIEVEAPGVDTDLPEISSTNPVLVPVVAERPTYIDLLKFTAKDESLATIKKKRAEYDLVKIDGVEDKEGYAKVKANMEQMRDDRRAFENAAYNNVIDPLKKALKEYADDIDAVVEEFKAGEKAERDKKDFIDDEKKRIKKEAEEAKERAALLRVNELNVLGAQFNGSVYTFEYDDSLMINVLQLKDFEQAEFDEFIEEVKAAHQVEQKRLADEKVRLEEEAETKRLADIAITEQAEQNKKDALALTEKRTKLRVKEITMMGYIWNQSDELYVHNIIPTSITLEEITIVEEDEWEQWINELQNYTPPVIETPATEPIADVQGTETSNQVTEDQWTENYTGTQGNDVVDENNIIIEEKPVPSGINLYFDLETPFTDADISGKLKMRVFPEEYREQALAGVASVANSGSFQGLQWIILPK